MSVFTKIFGKKKKEFKAFCEISKEPVEKGYGYLLTTSQVISSHVYWDNIMTEPETMAYTIKHFKENDSTATQIRKMLFDKFSNIDKPWIISDTYINWFNVDKTKARLAADNWWLNEGNFEPEDSGKAGDFLASQQLQELMRYAVLEAGRDKVA